MQLQEILAVVSVFGAIIGGLLMRDRQLHNKINDGERRLHDRVTRVQQDYVRKDDLRDHIATLENSVNQMRFETQQLNGRIDALLLTYNPNNRNER